MDKGLLAPDVALGDRGTIAPDFDAKPSDQAVLAALVASLAPGSADAAGDIARRLLSGHVSLAYLCAAPIRDLTETCPGLPASVPAVLVALGKAAAALEQVASAATSKRTAESAERRRHVRVSGQDASAELQVRA